MVSIILILFFTNSFLYTSQNEFLRSSKSQFSRLKSKYLEFSKFQFSHSESQSLEKSPFRYFDFRKVLSRQELILSMPIYEAVPKLKVLNWSEKSFCANLEEIKKNKNSCNFKHCYEPNFSPILHIFDLIKPKIDCQEDDYNNIKLLLESKVSPNKLKQSLNVLPTRMRKPECRFRHELIKNLVIINNLETKYISSNISYIKLYWNYRTSKKVFAIPLHKAAKKLDIELITLFLNNKADINMRNIDLRSNTKLYGRYGENFSSGPDNMMIKIYALFERSLWHEMGRYVFVKEEKYPNLKCEPNLGFYIAKRERCSSEELNQKKLNQDQFLKKYVKTIDLILKNSSFPFSKSSEYVEINNWHYKLIVKPDLEINYFIDFLRDIIGIRGCDPVYDTYGPIDRPEAIKQLDVRKNFIRYLIGKGLSHESKKKLPLMIYFHDADEDLPLHDKRRILNRYYIRQLNTIHKQAIDATIDYMMLFRRDPSRLELARQIVWFKCCLYFYCASKKYPVIIPKEDKSSGISLHLNIHIKKKIYDFLLNSLNYDEEQIKKEIKECVDEKNKIDEKIKITPTGKQREIYEDIKCKIIEKYKKKFKNIIYRLVGENFLK